MTTYRKEVEISSREIVFLLPYRATFFSTMAAVTRQTCRVTDTLPYKDYVSYVVRIGNADGFASLLHCLELFPLKERKKLEKLFVSKIVNKMERVIYIIIREEYSREREREMCRISRSSELSIADYTVPSPDLFAS